MVKKEHVPGKPLPEAIVSPVFLLICTLLTVGAVTFLLYWLSGLAFNELPIDLQPVKKNQTGIEKPAAERPAEVEVGLFIDVFDEFEVIKEEFILNGTVTFDFDPKRVSLDQFDKFSLQYGEILHHSDPTTTTVNGHTRAQYDVRLKFMGNLDFKWFPFEDHRLTIVLVNKIPNAPFIFTTKNNDFSAPDMNNKGWRRFGTEAEAGYLSEKVKGNIELYPAVAFSVDYGRWTNIRSMLMILLPMLLLFFIALFSLVINPAKNFIFVLTIPITAIAGLMSYRFVIENMSPKVGYFTFSDYFFLLFLFLMFSILIINTLGRHLGPLVRAIAIVVFDGIVILTLYLMLHHEDVVFATRFDLDANNIATRKK